MGSTPRRLKNFPATKTSSSSSSSQNKTRPSKRHHHKKPTHPLTIRTSSSVSDKLEALKNLIPAQEHYDISAAATTTSSSTSAADQLFQETADYILLLQTQVSVLQKLVDFYGSSSSSSVQPHSN